MGAAALVPWALSGKAKSTEASSLGGISKHEAVATRVDWWLASWKTDSSRRGCWDQLMMSCHISGEMGTGTCAR